MKKIIFSIFILTSIFVGNLAKADYCADPVIEQLNDLGGVTNTQWLIGQSFTATDENFALFSVKKRGDDFNNIKVRVCKGTPDPATITADYLCGVATGFDFMLLQTFTPEDLATTTDDHQWVDFNISDQTLTVGDVYFFTLEIFSDGTFTSTSSANMSYRTTTNGVNPYSGGVLLNSSGPLTRDLTFKIFDRDCIPQEEYDSAEVIELPGIEDVYVQTGNEIFDITKENYCYFDSDTDPCEIRFMYSYEDIGSMLILLPAYSTNLASNTDVILDLPDVAQLEGVLTPETMTEATTTEYWAFLSPDIGSSTLIQDINVHWISTTSDLLKNTPAIMQFFKNIFPLSIILPVKAIFDYYADTENAAEPLEVDIRNFMDDPYANTILNASSTYTIFSAQLLNNGLGGLWTTWIYPLFGKIMWLFTFVFTLLIIYKSFVTNEQDL